MWKAHWVKVFALLILVFQKHNKAHFIARGIKFKGRENTLANKEKLLDHMKKQVTGRDEGYSLLKK